MSGVLYPRSLTGVISPRSRFLNVKHPPKTIKNKFSVFFVYDSDPTKEHFSGGGNITKISLKSWQFFQKNSYWDFLSIFSDDFLLSPKILVNNNLSDFGIWLITRIILLGNDFFIYLTDFDEILGICKLAHQKNLS